MVASITPSLIAWKPDEGEYRGRGQREECRRSGREFDRGEEGRVGGGEENTTMIIKSFQTSSIQKLLSQNYHGIITSEGNTLATMYSASSVLSSCSFSAMSTNDILMGKTHSGTQGNINLTTKKVILPTNHPPLPPPPPTHTYKYNITDSAHIIPLARHSIEKPTQR